MTDTGAMYGAIEFYQACLANGVKPIIGFEALIGSELNHLVLLAENYTGYRNLMMLSSFGHTEGLVGEGHTELRCTEEIQSTYYSAFWLHTWRSNSNLLHNGKIESAKQAARTYQEIFE